VLGCVLLGSAPGVLTKAGVAVPVAVIVGAPVAAGALAWAVAQRRRANALSSASSVEPSLEHA
jgi:uncharacterized protein